MLKPKWTDEKIKAMICSGFKQRDQAFEYLVGERKWAQKAVAFLVKKGASNQDAQDVFQESIVVFDRNIRRNQFKFDSSLETYFLGIVKNKWVDRARRTKTTEPLDVLNNLATMGKSPLEAAIDQNRSEILAKAIDQLTHRCKELLHLYLLITKMEEIAMAAKLANAQVAKNETTRCRKALRQLIGHQRELYS